MKKNNICFSVIFRVAGSICILIAAALLYVYMFLVESPSLSMIFLLIAILASGILLLILGRLKDNKEKNIYKKNKLITSPKNKKLCMSATAMWMCAPPTMPEWNAAVRCGAFAEKRS